METKRRGRPPKAATPVVKESDSEMEIGAKARELVRQEKAQKANRKIVEEYWDVTEKGKLRRCFKVESGTVHRRYVGNIHKSPEMKALYKQLAEQGKVKVAV